VYNFGSPLLLSKFLEYHDILLLAELHPFSLHASMSVTLSHFADPSPLHDKMNGIAPPELNALRHFVHRRFDSGSSFPVLLASTVAKAI
jgi:hypothetical protein